MNNFYAQYTAIEPYLKKKDTSVRTEEYNQSPTDRAKLVCSIICSHLVTLLSTHDWHACTQGRASFHRMACMSAFCALAAVRLVPVTGGTRTNILALLSSCRLTGIQCCICGALFDIY